MSIWWDVNEYDHWLAVTSRQMQPGLLRLIYIINNVSINFHWRCYGSVKCLCLLFCCSNAFVLGVGGGEMLVGVWSVTWPLRIITVALFYSVEPEWCKNFMFTLRVFLYIRHQKWKRIDLLCLFQSTNVFSLWVCHSDHHVGDRIMPWTGRRSITGHTRLNFAPNFHIESHSETSHL